jgi:hypothetical protein
MPVVKLGIIGHVVGRGFSPPMRTLATWPNTIARHSVTPRPPVLLVDGRADAEVFFLVYQFLRRENTANGRKIGAYRVTVIVHLSSRPSIIHCRVLCRVCIVESYSICFLCRATPVTIQDRTLLVGFYGKKKPRCTLFRPGIFVPRSLLPFS